MLKRWPIPGLKTCTFGLPNHIATPHIKYARSQQICGHEICVSRAVSGIGKKPNHCFDYFPFEKFSDQNFEMFEFVLFFTKIFDGLSMLVEKKSLRDFDAGNQAVSYGRVSL